MSEKELEFKELRESSDKGMKFTRKVLAIFSDQLFIAQSRQQLIVFDMQTLRIIQMIETQHLTDMRVLALRDFQFLIVAHSWISLYKFNFQLRVFTELQTIANQHYCTQQQAICLQQKDYCLKILVYGFFHIQLIKLNKGSPPSISRPFLKIRAEQIVLLDKLRHILLLQEFDLKQNKFISSIGRVKLDKDNRTVFSFIKVFNKFDIIPTSCHNYQLFGHRNGNSYAGVKKFVRLSKKTLQIQHKSSIQPTWFLKESMIKHNNPQVMNPQRYNPYLFKSAKFIIYVIYMDQEKEITMSDQMEEVIVENCITREIVERYYLFKHPSKVYIVRPKKKVLGEKDNDTFMLMRTRISRNKFARFRLIKFNLETQDIQS